MINVICRTQYTLFYANHNQYNVLQEKCTLWFGTLRGVSLKKLFLKKLLIFLFPLDFILWSPCSFVVWFRHWYKRNNKNYRENVWVHWERSWGTDGNSWTGGELSFNSQIWFWFKTCWKMVSAHGKGVFQVLLLMKRGVILHPGS